jgi:glucose-1-phosphate adenylyltransferase
MSVLTLILAGGMGTGLSVLTETRAKPALPFGGKYRIIDFALSNVANSYLNRVAILIQFNASSLIEHIGSGVPWGFGQSEPNGLQIWQANVGRTDLPMYRGTADAVYQNRKYILETGCDQVLIIGGDPIYLHDFRELIRFHQEKGADFTISSTIVSAEETQRFGMMEINADQQIVSFVEKPKQTDLRLASLGMYLFNTQYLLNLLEEDARDPDSAHDFGRSVLPKAIQRDKGYAFVSDGCWMDVHTLEAYWKTNLALLGPQAPFTLDDPNWVIRTQPIQKPAMRAGASAVIHDSLITDGCVIEGEVSNSVLSAGVRVEKGAVVRSSILFADSVIRAGAVVNRCIIDENVEIGENAQVGTADALPAAVNLQEPERLNFGVTIVGKQARIPAQTVIGANCRIGSRVTAEDFPDQKISSGQTIAHKEN